MNARPIRRRSHWRPASLAAASVVWLVSSGIHPAQLAAVDAPTVGWRSDSLKASDNWNTLTLDINVKRKRINTSGQVVGVPSPATTYRLVRSSKSGAWKTVVTVLSIERPTIYALSGKVGTPSPLSIARLEDDEDGTPVRAYDKGGRQLRAVPLASTVVPDTAGAVPPRTSGRSWINALVATGATKNLRQQNYERAFGKATKVNGMSRYFKATADSSEEVLADTKTVVAMQNTLTRNKKLTVKRVFTYTPAYTDAIVRSVTHSEVVANPDGSERAIVDTQFSNIRLSLERRP